MSNTIRNQLSSSVFAGTSQTGVDPEVLQRPLRGVRQDKGALTRARVASLRPAAQEKTMRSRALNNKFPRIQKHHSTKRKTVPLTLWVEPIEKTELGRIAEREGLSLSAVGGAFMRKGMQANLDMEYGALLQPVIEKAITKQMRGISTRLALLLVRVAFDAGQTRSVATNILGRMPGVTPDMLKTILAESGKTAKANITARTPQINELIEAVEKWLGEEDKQEDKKS
jgi:hypothetical protein